MALLVSVIVATNRGGPFLAEALASVRAQTYGHVELLVVDDGSPDPAALARVADGARILRLPPSGVSAARNRGVEETSGDLIAFLDDDDRWHPDRLAAQVAAFEARPRAVVTYCQMHTIDEAGNRLVPGDQRPARGPADVIRGRAGVMLPNLMIRRETFTAIGGFDPAYRQGEDLDLVLRALRHGSFAFVPAPLVDYRHHGSNTTASHRDLAAALRTILLHHRGQAAADGRDDLVTAYTSRLRANDRFAAWSGARAARDHLRRGHYSQAAGELAWAGRFAPWVPLTWLRARLSPLVGVEP